MIDNKITRQRILNVLIRTIIESKQFQSLPEKALTETLNELEKILEFYSDYSSQDTLETLSSKTIEATLMPPRIRPAIVLDSE